MPEISNRKANFLICFHCSFVAGLSSTKSSIHITCIPCPQKGGKFYPILLHKFITHRTGKIYLLFPDSLYIVYSLVAKLQTRYSRVKNITIKNAVHIYIHLPFANGVIYRNLHVPKFSPKRNLNFLFTVSLIKVVGFGCRADYY